MHKKIRIAVVTAVFPPYWSGISNVAYHNSIELARRGHAVHVFTAQYPLKGYHDPDEFAVHRLWTPLRIGNAPLTPTLMIALQSFNLIHLHWPFIFGSELTWLASQLSRTPYVMTYHLDLKADRKWIFGTYQRLWGPVLARGARKILAVSTGHLQSSEIYPFLKNRQQDIKQVPNGVDTVLFNPSVSGNTIRKQYGIPDNDCVILFVGSMDKAHEYKGVPDLINAFGLLNNSRTWLLLVGSGELLPTYRALAMDNSLQYRQQVIFIGSKAYNQLPEYYSAADVLVLPSRQPESFGMVLIEAMACGKPVIASDSPGVRTVVSDGEDGLVIQPGDIDGLASALRLLLTDPDKRTVMGQNGRAKVELKYTWAKIADQLEQVYAGVL